MSQEYQLIEYLRGQMRQDEEVSMTEATERLWGTSGRGSPKATRLLEELAARGYVAIRTVGRARYVRLGPDSATFMDGRTFTVGQKLRQAARRAPREGVVVGFRRLGGSPFVAVVVRWSVDDMYEALPGGDLEVVS